MKFTFANFKYHTVWVISITLTMMPKNGKQMCHCDINGELNKLMLIWVNPYPV